MIYKILTIVGARPHFIKAVAVSDTIQNEQSLNEIIVHTGQHYDYKMSQSFFDELGLPIPKYNLEVGSGRPAWQMGQIIIKLDEVVERENPDLMIVYGDTNSTAAAAITAAKNNIPLAHIEAGLREHCKQVPEEINKLVTDAVSDLYFCPTPTGVKNLKKEGITKNVFHVGDVGIDLIHQGGEKLSGAEKLLNAHKIKPKEYFFITCHRAANTDDVGKLSEILSILPELNADVIFSIHPRTRRAIDKFSLNKYLDFPNIKTVTPLGFWETQMFIKNAKMILTDSGGIIKEAYYHRVPAVILDTQSEWIETIEEGWNYLAGPNKQKVLSRIKSFQLPEVHSGCLGNGNAASQIIKHILAYLNAEK